MKNFFNTSVNRETSCVWRFKIVPDSEQSKNFVLRKYHIEPQSVEPGVDFKTSMKAYNKKVNN